MKRIEPPDVEELAETIVRYLTSSEADVDLLSEDQSKIYDISRIIENFLTSKGINVDYNYN